MSKAKKRKWAYLRIILASVGVPLLAGGGLRTLNQGGFFNVDKIETEIVNSEFGNSEKTPLHLVAGVKALEEKMGRFRGASLWSLDLEKLSNEVSQLKWVESSHLVRVWPSTLRLKISPQKILLLYKGERGDLRPLTANGEFLDPIPASEAPDVTVLTGESFAKKKKLREEALEVIKKIPKVGSFSRQTIAELSYDPREGFWMNLIQPRVHIKMGEGDIPMKSLRISQVVDYLENQQLEARVIDANLPQKVLVRLRKDP